MNLLMSSGNREGHLHIRIKPDIKDDLKILSDMRGLTVSGLVQHLIVKAIREGKNEDPSIFQTDIAVIKMKAKVDASGIGRPLAASSKDKIKSKVNKNENIKTKRSA